MTAESSAAGVHPIEAESYRILEGLVDLSGFGPLGREVAARVVHATADPDLAATLSVEEESLALAVEALAGGAAVVADVEMVRAGLRADACCHLGEARAAGGRTRSARAVRAAAAAHPVGAVWVVGCAPTALAELLELAAEGSLRPAFVVGLPVGFVGAAESKAALRASGLPSISNVGVKGGSAAAAGAFNALHRVADRLGSPRPRRPPRAVPVGTERPRSQEPSHSGPDRGPAASHGAPGDAPCRVLLVAHGTKSLAGQEDTLALAQAVAAGLGVPFRNGPDPFPPTGPAHPPADPVGSPSRQAGPPTDPGRAPTDSFSAPMGQAGSSDSRAGPPSDPGRSRGGSDLAEVRLGYLELCDPPAGDVLDAMIRSGAGTVVTVPLMLHAAGHAKSDVPAVVLDARARHPGADLRYGRPLGSDHGLVMLARRRLEEADALGLPLAVISRGTSDPDANAEAYRVARLVADSTGARLVVPGFSGMTWPDTTAALDQLRLLGAERVAVFSWFLATGVLLDRIRLACSDFAARTGVEVVDAGYLGADPAVADVVADRVGEVAAGVLRPAGSCDTCLYRRPFPGLEDRVGAARGSGHSHLAAEHLHGHRH